MPRMRVLLLLVLGVALLSGAECGGSSSKSSSSSKSKSKGSPSKDSKKTDLQDEEKEGEFKGATRENPYSFDQSADAVCERHRQKLRMNFDMWVQNHPLLPAAEIKERRSKFEEEMEATATCEGHQEIFSQASKNITLKHQEFRKISRGDEHLLPLLGEHGAFIGPDDKESKPKAEEPAAAGVPKAAASPGAARYEAAHQMARKDGAGVEDPVAGAKKMQAKRRDYQLDGKTRKLQEGVHEALLPGLGQGSGVRDVFMGAIFGGEIMVVWTDVPHWRTMGGEFRAHADGHLGMIKGRVAHNDHTAQKYPADWDMPPRAIDYGWEEDQTTDVKPGERMPDDSYSMTDHKRFNPHFYQDFISKEISLYYSVDGKDGDGGIFVGKPKDGDEKKKKKKKGGGRRLLAGGDGQGGLRGGGAGVGVSEGGLAGGLHELDVGGPAWPVGPGAGGGSARRPVRRRRLGEGSQAAHHARGNWELHMIKSRKNGGETWEAPDGALKIMQIDGLEGSGHGFRSTVKATGWYNVHAWLKEWGPLVEWMLPVTHWDPKDGPYSMLMWTNNMGESYNNSRITHQGEGLVRPVVIRDPADNKLLAFVVPKDGGRIHITRSKDEGRTWSRPAATQLPCSGARIDAKRLITDEIVIVFNSGKSASYPGPLTVAVSRDGGNTWPHFRDIDPPELFDPGLEHDSPSLVYLNDKSVHLVYSWGGRRSHEAIRYLRFKDIVGWVKAADGSSAGAYKAPKQRQVVEG